MTTTLKRYTGLVLGEGDGASEAAMRDYARGVVHGLRENWFTLQCQAQQAREHGFEEVIDTRVFWDNEPHDMSFDAFIAWCTAGLPGGGTEREQL